MAWCDPYVPYMLRYEFDSILDIGCGDGNASRLLHDAGRRPTSIAIHDLQAPWEHIVGEFMAHDFSEGTCKCPYCGHQRQFDAILASAIMEHIQDTGAFLAKVRSLLKPGGWFFCLVPQAKVEVVGGHVNLYTMGHLIYNLILGGFDCQHGRFASHGYHLVAFVQAATEPLPPLVLDNGDIETLADRFPMEVKQGFSGNCGSVNWFDD